jgi:hypothetical protein
MSVTGSCLCGRFAFRLEGELAMMTNCHCGYCRKSHGAAYATFVRAERLVWTAGEGEQHDYRCSPEMPRAFCPTCGSKVPASGQTQNVFVPAGLLEGDPGVRPEAHIFVGHKAPWYDVSDGVPAFEGPPPRYPDPQLPTRPRPQGARDGAIAGSCLCGAVAWEHTKPSKRMGHCHCSRCRRARSAAFSSTIFAESGDFRWIRGREEVQEFHLPGAAFYGSSFCRACGSPVPKEAGEAIGVLIPAGALDDDPGTRPMANIYVASKAPWVELRDGLPQFDEMPPG